jgi:hypothetical protein
MDNQDILISRKAAAKLLGIKPHTLAVWACTKRHPLPYVKVGRLAKYRMSDLMKFIDSRTIGGALRNK